MSTMIVVSVGADVRRRVNVRSLAGEDTGPRLPWTGTDYRQPVDGSPMGPYEG